MPGSFLTRAERARLSSFPTEISRDELLTYFTLSSDDVAAASEQRGDHNRLGYALQLSSVRYMGFVPEDLLAAPMEATLHLARQLEVSPQSLSRYGDRVQTRTDHLQSILAHLRYRRVTPLDLSLLEQWLLERALEHDRPSLLFELACQKLKRDRILRPGITRIERAVTAAREQAHQATYHRLGPLLTEQRLSVLDELLEPDPESGIAHLTWLRQSAVSNTPAAILEALEKLAWLRKHGVHRWDLGQLNPNRRKLLAGLARRQTNQALRRTRAERRYPMLVCLLRQTLTDVIDELLDLYDACLHGTHARAKRDLDEYRKRVARATDTKIRIFHLVGRLVLDDAITDQELRQAIYRRISRERLEEEVAEASAIMRPRGLSHYDFLERRYGYLRRFAPAFLAALAFRSNLEDDPLLEATDVLRTLNANGRRKLPEDAPLRFVSKKWAPHVFEQKDRPCRRAWELCLLSELRDALRAGDLYLRRSRRYANPESYLIPKSRWPGFRTEALEELALPERAQGRLQQHKTKLETLGPRIDQLLKGKASKKPVRVEEGELVVRMPEGLKRPDRLKRFSKEISKRLPRIELSDLLVEVDTWTGFSKHLQHAAGSEPAPHDGALLNHLHASVLAQGTGLTFAEIAQSADLSFDQLVHATGWHIREETVKSAVAALVNFQHRQPLAARWGGGTLSSSDGQRFPTSGKVKNARALPRYFGYGKGITFYTWSSDQYSQYGTKVISATVRDATYILDEILDNETELTILEHTSDTEGYTEIIFCLFDLLGMQFSPRIRDIGDQRLYRMPGVETPSRLDFRFTGRINMKLIERHWDDLLRVAGSLKFGYVTSSLLVSKLQSYRRQNRLTRALKEYGRLIKTTFILRYLENEAYRRRINAQLNKGEKLHALRRFLFFGSNGKVRRKQEEGQTCQAGCLNLVTNAVIVWNTIYMQAAIDELRKEGYELKDEDLARLSPARTKHINRYGKYRFDVDEARGRVGLRKLRGPHASWQ